LGISQSYRRFLSWVGATLLLGAVMVIGTLRSNGASSELRADGRTGRMARLLNDDKLCRYIVFDNKTAQAPKTESAVVTKATKAEKRNSGNLQPGR
jgi:hypothetical protein